MRWSQRVEDERSLSDRLTHQQERDVLSSEPLESPTREQRVAVGVCGCVWGEWVGGFVGVCVGVWVCGCVCVDVCVCGLVPVCCLLCHTGNDPTPSRVMALLLSIYIDVC